MESMTGLFSARAFSNASGPHENQSTGLWACWSKYGLVSWMRRLVCCPLMITLSAPQSLCAFAEGSRLVHCRVDVGLYLLFPLPLGEGEGEGLFPGPGAPHPCPLPQERE